MVTAFSATGNLGYGFPEASLRRALEEGVTFLGSDAGSTDPGPYYLGHGEAFVSRSACKRDARLLLRAAVENDLPLVIGSAGGSGSNHGVAWLADIVREVASEDGLHFAMATVEAELDSETLHSLLTADRIEPIAHGPVLDDASIAQCGRVVAMMGPEPIQAALDHGAQVVIAGRCSDAALFAAIPMSLGIPSDVAWHAGKIIECGAAIAVPKSSDCMVARLDSDGFELQCPNPTKTLHRGNVAAHSMYENADAFILREPGGTLDTSRARFEQVDERRVRVEGAKFHATSNYTVKLEGAALVGHRAVTIGGTRDPGLIQQIDNYLADVETELHRKATDVYGADQGFKITFRVYGQNGVMASREQIADRCHELGILIDVVAETQQMASDLVAMARTLTMHSHFPGRLCNAGNLAFPFSPSDLQAPPVYRFTLNHVAVLDSPTEFFPIALERL